MLDIARTGLTNPDLGMVFALAVLWPIYEFISIPRMHRSLAEGAPGIRSKLYRQTIHHLLIVAIAVLAVWAYSGRDWASLGFRFQWDLGTMIAMGITMAVMLYFIVQIILVSTHEKTRKVYADALAKAGDVTRFMPASVGEYRLFSLVGLTAGITEEIIFRGFVIWAAAQVMPVWAAALASLALFTILHAYQGKNGMGQVLIIGSIVTFVYVISGSLLPVVLLHIAVDVLNNMLLWRARRPQG